MRLLLDDDRGRLDVLHLRGRVDHLRGRCIDRVVLSRNGLRANQWLGVAGRSARWAKPVLRRVAGGDAVERRHRERDVGTRVLGRSGEAGWAIGLGGKLPEIGKPVLVGLVAHILLEGGSAEGDGPKEFCVAVH